MRTVNRGHEPKMNFSVSSLYEWYRSAIRHPKYRWWVMLGTAIYLISPIDIAPDFIPVLGQLDDVMLAGLLFTELSQMALAKLQTRQADKGNANTGTSDNPAEEVVDVDAETVATN